MKKNKEHLWNYGGLRERENKNWYSAEPGHRPRWGNGPKRSSELRRDKRIVGAPRVKFMNTR